MNLGCSNSAAPAAASGQAHFPQGVASGDPRPDSIMLWTRAEPLERTATIIRVKLEVALDKKFQSLIVQQQFLASDEADYTLRVLVESLSADTTYYYRFISHDQVSTIGRTRTAPDPTSTTEIRFAFMSCQERQHGYYNAYRNLIDRDEMAAADEQIRFILHLGDFIYETRNDPLQSPVDNLNNDLPRHLADSSGTPRTIEHFVDGNSSSTGIEFAESLSDYRQLYRQYLSDPDLQAARTRWPFVMIWDDHEFTDDCWQTEANYENSGIANSTDEPSQPRKLAANQAWFEFTPANLTFSNHTDADLWHAHDFKKTTAGITRNDLINDQNMAVNQDNLKAISSMSIYRSLQFGQLLQLILTDNRSYRSDHAIPEDLTGNIDLFISDRVALPLELQNALDAGRTANNGNPDTFIFLGSPVLNPRRFSPPGTMLGSTQRAWLKETLKRCDSRWKIWGNSVPLMRLMLNLSALGSLTDLLLTADSWDGYNSERKDLMQFILDEDIRNVVSLSGDLHAHFAGSIHLDYDATTAPPRNVMVEAVCAAVSSRSQFSVLEKSIRRDQPTAEEAQVQKLVSYVENHGQVDQLVNNFNNLLLNGVDSALTAEAGGSQQDIQDNRDLSVNPHLEYADTDANGYGIAHISSDKMMVDLVTVESVNTHDDQARQQKRIARFEIPYTMTGQEPRIMLTEIIGEKPFPYT